MTLFKNIITILLLLPALACIHSAYGQTKQLTKPLKKKMNEANYYFNYENYHLALPVLQELYKEDTVNSEINFKIGVCLYNIKRNKTEARRYFEKAANDYIDSYYYLGNIYHLQMNFDKAISTFQYYKYWYGKKTYSWDEADYLINKSTAAKSLIMFPQRVTINSISTKINTKNPEYVPLITSDESTLFFTSRRPSNIGGKKDPLGEYFEDIWVSRKLDTNWTELQNLGAPVNTPSHDACVAITPDGSKLFLYRTNKELTGGSIYISELKNSVWSEPALFGGEINYPGGLEASGTISPDETVFYFSSNRPGGYGGKDIYRVIKFPNGQWSKAMNLGPTINTQYDEDAPFIHPDGKTLYFSSKGHKNMGGYDIFRTIQNDEGVWSNPENIGYPINTVNDDLFFVSSADNMRGYYSCDREGTGNSDIYVINMPDNNSNFRLLKGVVTNSDSIPQIVKATITITLIDNQTNTLQGVYRTNQESGKYLLIVEPAKKYKVIVEADEYESFVDILEIPAKVEEQIIYKNIKLRHRK
ncbi:MAG: PD40 domain-containing protein [Bacteroidia bacterium]|nr:PD40 domain-containing protein [Bacteroidia bacterium]